MSAAVALLQRLTEVATGLLDGGYLLVQDGEGFEAPPPTITLRSGAKAPVVRVDSELALRHALWQAHGALVALLPAALATDLAADLRLGAERQRVHTISGDEVLSALLWPARVAGIDDAELRSLAIEHIDLIQTRLNSRTMPTVVDRGLLERTLVEVVTELGDLRLPNVRLGVLLARWATNPPVWPAAVRRLAQGALEANHGDSGRVLAWALEAPAARARALVVRGAVLSVDGEVPPKLWGPLAPLRDEGGPLRAPMVARALVVELATGAVAELRHVARPMLDEADTIARTELSDTGQSRTSRLLPLAFEELAHDLAGRFEAGFPAPRALMTALRAHALAGTHARELELLADLDRLARYLHHAHGAPTGTALARAYLVDHAWADRCARRVENAIASSTRHERAARALLRKVRDARDAVNTTWTRGLQGAYGSTLFSADVVALQNVVRDEVVPRLHDRGVFLLVLDGCSVPVFLELLDQLCEPTNGIGLEVGPGLALRWRVGLSPLPTITSHARGALFLGAVPKDPFAAETLWREDGERKSDPARFKQNQALGDRPRSLFLKGDLADGGQALRDALRGPDAVVAAVFNAVDDRIGSHDTASAWRLHVDDVHGLVPALQAAFHAGRRVLATADHGHTPFRGTDGRVGAGNTPRYARLKDGDAVPDGFAEIDCGDLAGQPGRTAYAWRTGAYRGQVQVGFHGGCSLEEMVVPVAWLARDGVPADPPPWWIDGGGDEETRDAPPPRVEPSAAAGDPPPKGAPPPPGPAPGLPFAKPAAPVERIPALILAVLDEDQARAVAWILADGPLRTSVVAKRLGRPEGRVDGWLVKLARTLAGHGAKLVAEELPDGEKQWRYSGPEVAA